MNRAPRLARGLAALVLVAGTVATAVAGCSAAPGASATRGPVSVEIAFRNHPPVKAVLTDVNAVLAKYGAKVVVARHDVDVADSESFMKGKGLDNTCVLAIYIDGSTTYAKDSGEVKFYSFPVGKGTAMTAAGNWTVDDLDAALAKATQS